MRALVVLLLSTIPMYVPAAGGVGTSSSSAVSTAAWIGIATVGGPGAYEVRAGDNPAVISGRLGTSSRRLRTDNPAIGKRLMQGQTLVYDNRHIVPPAPADAGDAILVNIPQRMLFRYRDGIVQDAWPVSAGRSDKVWRTPTGDASIATREKDKTWIVPPSIQAEMRAKGEPVLERVPPGPKNPLGRYWLGLSIPGLGIHGTNAPSSIYGLRTHGCIRMQPEHIEALFNAVSKGVPVRLAYAPVLLFAPPGGPVWLEAHADAYARRLDYPALLRGLADAAGVTERIDWPAAESVLKEQSGLATDVARRPETQPKP